MRELAMTRIKRTLFALAVILLALPACTSPSSPSGESPTSRIVHDGSLRIAALDYQIGDLNDPAVLAKYSRADVLVVQCDQFWGRASFSGRMDLLRASNPDLKIIGYFRSKVVKTQWGEVAREAQTYNYDLYQASLPYWSHTTTGDTVTDWPGAVLFDYTDPAARAAMLEVFMSYQNASTEKFDGVYWDYFNPKLWIAPTVNNMNGEPDLDQDGIAHWDDADELQAFVDGQDAWVAEMEAAMGRGFIQIANGYRALQDSTFAGKFDGMYYEIFPNVGFTGGARFDQALDVDRYNNLWTARSWPRETNGGPWLILGHAPRVGSYQGPDGQWLPVNASDLTRVMALMTDATAIHFDNSGSHRAGIPTVELNLGRALGGATVDGDFYTREFEHGRVGLQMGTGSYPVPFDYQIIERDVIVEEITSSF